jgi:hypothetical protein
MDSKLRIKINKYTSIQVVNARAALLSNFEVLTLLKELEADHLAKAKTAQRIKKEEEASGVVSNHHPVTDQICEHLRTIEVEVGSSAYISPISHGYIERISFFL